jgi:hypothetical protein
MRKHDPKWDFYEFEAQVRFIFKNILEAFYTDNIEALELLTCEQAFGLLSGLIKQRKTKKIELKYKDILFLDDARFHDSTIEADDTVRFQFILDAQEINCLVDIEDNSEVKEGDPSFVEGCNYIIEIMMNQEPMVELVGHPWVVTKVIRTGVVKQLI